MEKKTFSGTTKEEALSKAKEHFNASEEELFYRIVSRRDNNIELDVFTKEEINLFLKDFVKELLYKMNIEGNFEVLSIDKGSKITIYSNNDSILIGKNGKTIEAITIILRQIIDVKYGLRFNVLVDVSDYRRRKDKHIEQAALDTAREVFKTNIEVHLEAMNSYQRRLVHTVLTDNKFVYTTSEGEEPNRHVVIKPKEEE